MYISILTNTAVRYVCNVRPLPQLWLLYVTVWDSKFSTVVHKKRIAYVLKQQKSCTIGKNASSTLPGRKLEKHVNNFDQYNAETDKQKTMEVFIFYSRNLSWQNCDKCWRFSVLCGPKAACALVCSMFFLTRILNSREDYPFQPLL